MKISQATKDQAVNMYTAGVATYKIANQIGVTSGTVTNWVKKAGVPVRKGWTNESMRAFQYGKGPLKAPAK